MLDVQLHQLKGSGKVLGVQEWELGHRIVSRIASFNFAGKDQHGLTHFR